MEPLTAEDPRQISVFRLESRLGAGGMGRVYLARSPGGRPVALKVVHPELARDPEFMQRFRREVEAAEAVSGAYTAPVIGAGPDDSPPWLATAYVPGPSLAELLTRTGPLPEAAVWRLAGGLTEALADHSRPSPGAPGPQAGQHPHRGRRAAGDRLRDFPCPARGGDHGRPHDHGHARLHVTRAGRGQEIGAESDIFSLGSVLAFAATGAAPFDGGNTLSVIYRIVHDEADLSRITPGLAGPDRRAAWPRTRRPGRRPPR